MTKINLNNNITDPSLMREALSYDLFREAKIPASRVGYARVYLTISDETKREIKREPIGLFTLVEQKDKRFLRLNYGSSKGLLMKPSTFGLFRYLGEDWDEYQIGFVPKTDPTEEQKRRVIEFAKLIHKSDFDEFEERYEEYLDVDQYLRFLACNVIVCNLDSFLGGSQNHYIYLDPESNKFQFLPWDMDHSFGAFHMMGDPNARRRLSIDRPVTDNPPIIDRVLQVSGNKEKYHAYIEEYMNTIFDESVMLKKIKSVGDFVRPMVNLNGGDAESRFDQVLADKPSMFEQHPLKYFVKVRHESIRAQLDGTSLGQSVGFGGLPDLGPYYPLIISALVLVFVQSIGWIWGIVVGFRGSTLWGCLNIFFSPWAPAIYGFAIRRDLGFRCAIYSMFCIAAWGIWIFLLFFHKSIFGE
jgi:spore coat protein CotH